VRLCCRQETVDRGDSVNSESEDKSSINDTEEESGQSELKIDSVKQSASHQIITDSEEDLEDAPSQQPSPQPPASGLQSKANQNNSEPVVTSTLLADNAQADTAQASDSTRPKWMRAAVQVFYSSCCDTLIDEATKRTDDVVECCRKGCETRWVHVFPSF
jgi:hypothetical protein